MKWLFLFDENHLYGGFQTCLNELGRELMLRDHRLDILYFRKNPFKKLQQDFPEHCRITLATMPSTRSLRAGCLRQAWKYLRESRPDAVFFCCTGTPNYLPFVFLAPVFRVRHVIAQFGTEVQLPRELPKRRNAGGVLSGIGFWRKELLWSAKLAYRHLTLALFNNDEQMQNWQSAMRLPEEKCDLWSYPIDLQRFRRDGSARDSIRWELNLSTDAFVIGGVGGLNRQKSFDASIRALAEIGQRLPHAQLVIAGDGPMRGELETLAHELNLTDRVHLLGPRTDVHRLMNAFDIFCMPSSHPNETLGIVFVEAQACGVPIVVPDLPGPRRVARDGRCGLIVPPGDVHALATAWLDLAEQAKLRSDMRTAGLEAAGESERSLIVDRLLGRMGEAQQSAETIHV